MEASVVSMEYLWNKFALEEDDQRKKLWLDIFLCRALVWTAADGDQFLATHIARTCVAPILVTDLKEEIGTFCSSTLATEDLEQLRRYVLMPLIDHVLSG
jgi:hypothetical protein